MRETKFKDTEIGRIPEDWDTYHLGDITQITSGGTPSTSEPNYWGGDIPWMNSGELNLKIVGSVEGRITEKGLKYSSTKWIPKNCVLIGLAGQGKTRGTSAYNTIPLCINQSIGAIFPCNVLNNKYLYYYMSTLYTYLRKISDGGGGRGGLTKVLIQGIEVPVPDRAEQSRIASALTSIDNLISSLDKLIEKKKSIKQGTMQQLLTGKKRLKGFSDPWVEKVLGRIGETYSGLTGKTKDDFGVGNARYITFLNVLNNPILKPYLFENVNVKDSEHQNLAKKGDLFFNTSSETPEEVGICAMLEEEFDELYLNSFCFGYRLTDKSVYPKYMAYYFRSTEGRKLMTMLAQGVTRYNMSKAAFNSAKIFMPASFDEQKTIADMLASIDREIESIRIKKAKYESIKQGMMQQLLTGKIRLVSHDN